jgi:hypothetical protein
VLLALALLMLGIIMGFVIASWNQVRKRHTCAIVDFPEATDNNADQCTGLPDMCERLGNVSQCCAETSDAVATLVNNATLCVPILNAMIPFTIFANETGEWCLDEDLQWSFPTSSAANAVAAITSFSPHAVIHFKHYRLSLDDNTVGIFARAGKLTVKEPRINSLSGQQNNRPFSVGIVSGANAFYGAWAAGSPSIVIVESPSIANLSVALQLIGGNMTVDGGEVSARRDLGALVSAGGPVNGIAGILHVGPGHLDLERTTINLQVFNFSAVPETFTNAFSGFAQAIRFDRRNTPAGTANIRNAVLTASGNVIMSATADPSVIIERSHIRALPSMMLGSAITVTGASATAQEFGSLELIDCIIDCQNLGQGGHCLSLNSFAGIRIRGGTITGTAPLLNSTLNFGNQLPGVVSINIIGSATAASSVNIRTPRDISIEDVQINVPDRTSHAIAIGQFIPGGMRNATVSLKNVRVTGGGSSVWVAGGSTNVDIVDCVFENAYWGVLAANGSVRARVRDTAIKTCCYAIELRAGSADHIVRGNDLQGNTFNIVDNSVGSAIATDNMIAGNNPAACGPVPLTLQGWGVGSIVHSSSSHFDDWGQQ